MPTNTHKRRAEQRIADLERENERLRNRGDWYKKHKKQAEAKLAEARALFNGQVEGMLRRLEGIYPADLSFCSGVRTVRERLAAILKETE